MRAVKIKMRNLVALFFSLFLTLAVFSQISAANPKPTYDVGLNKADWMYSKSNNDTIAYLGKKSSSLPAVRYQKGNDFLEFALSGNGEAPSVSLETNVKEPNTPSLFYRNVFDENTDFVYKITNLPFRVKEEIVLQSKISNLKSKNLIYTFDAETTAKPVKQQDGSIAFFDAKGQYLFQLDKPFMVDAKGNRSEEVRLEIRPVKTKNTSEEMFFGDSDLERNSDSRLPLNQQFNGIKSFVNSLKNKYVDNKKVLDLGGIEPPDSQVATWSPLQARPRTNIFYHKEKETEIIKQYTIILKADSDWLNSPDRSYPVIIDPTITHNADANFTGQMNRIADADSTSSTQLESSYPEATKDPYTVLLLHFNEANGSTNIKDYASSTRVITANGNVSTTNYVTQLGMGNSAAFDGTGDDLTMPGAKTLSGFAALTATMWVNQNSIVGGDVSALVSNNAGGGPYNLYINTSSQPYWYLVTANGTYNTTSSISMKLDQWYHLAYVYDGSNIFIYVNGVLTASAAATGIINTGSDDTKFSIGRRSDGLLPFDGFIDEVKISNRALTPEEIKAAASRRPYAVYTSSVLDATASVAWNTLNWTEGGVNTGNGEQPYNTSSLVAQWDFNDTSGTTLTASSSGSCTTSCNGTLTNFAYTASQDQATTTTGWTANNKRWGAGALMFDGANDYVGKDSGVSGVGGTSAMTLETWVNRSSDSSETVIAGGDTSTYQYFRMSLNYNSVAGSIRADFGNDANNDYSIKYTTTNSVSSGIWHYVVATYNAGTVKIYVDGLEVSGTTAGSWTGNVVTPTTYLRIGNQYAAGNAAYFSGIIDSTRIYSRALSAAEILSNYNAGNIEIQTRTGATSDPNDGTWEAWKPTTGETQLLSMDSDAANWKTTSDKFTKLLIHADEANGSTSLTDSSPQNYIITAIGNASTTNTQSKFGGLSVAFDGTLDYLTIPDSEDWNFGAGNFTIDLWARFNADASAVFYSHQFETSSNRVEFYYEQPTSQIFFVSVDGGVNKAHYKYSFTPTLNQWYHFAAVRNGTNFYIFQDGVSKTLTEVVPISTNILPNINDVLRIGESEDLWGSVNGYLDEVRVSKGVARWTSNFTPPAFAHPNQEGAISRNNETIIKQENTGSAKFTLGAPQLDGNTVALWHFEETGTTTGTYLYDSTSNHNDATTTGTTVVDGIFGKGRYFDGVDDNLTVPDSANWNFGTGDFSIDTWVKPNTVSAICTILGQRPDADNFFAFAFNQDSATGLEFRIKSATVITVNLKQGNTSGWTANNWYHVAATRRGNDWNLYRNGESIASLTDADGFSDLAGNLIIGAQGSLIEYCNGTMDELRILKGRALSPDEIAETYRMGANHHLTRQVSATDLSSANKLAFNIASDRPGTYLETMLGESDYANYELASSTLALSTTTVLYIKGDEIASSTSIKDSSFSGKAITANGNARTSGTGKIGNSVYFDGTGDYLSLADSSDWAFGSGNFSIDGWFRRGSIGTDQTLVTNHSTCDGIWSIAFNTSNQIYSDFLDTVGPNHNYITSAKSITDTTNWHHVAYVRSGNIITNYIDGVIDGAVDVTGKSVRTMGGSVLTIGSVNGACSYDFNGHLDELRVIKGTALTPDQIRQAYEYGLRSHQITIDFGATLQPSDLISNSTDYNFSITATTSGLSATTSGLYLGDKIIIKENLGGTEYTAQGTVNSINSTTGAITVPSWDNGSTFPSGNGYSPNATVFKWQREYFDLTGAATTTRNAVTNLTLRPTNGAEGRTVYLDDFRYNTNYLTASSSSAIISSNGRYLQYRAIFSSWDSFVSPYLSAINTLYTSLATMFPPVIGVSGGGFLSF